MSPSCTWEGETQATTTIAAIATASGRGGIGVIRVSGPKVPEITQILFGQLPPARKAHYGAIKDKHDHVIDMGIALYFPAPHSYTKESVLELQGHGGPVVLNCVLKRVLELGACLAQPGEFSQRAFLNGQLDLAQVEAVADLIEASSEQAARAALRSLQGDFSKAINAFVDEVVACRVWIESSIDFPDEDLDQLTQNEILNRLVDLENRLEHILKKAQQGAVLRDGWKVVLVGEPNVGKSTLLNALSEKETAIVTAVPGTTRDLITQEIHLNGIRVELVDTAGIRQDPDEIEEKGIERAIAQLALADRILFVSSDTHTHMPSRIAEILEPHSDRTIEVINKIDLTGQSPKVQGRQVYLSAHLGQGLEGLKHCLLDSLGDNACAHEDGFLARTRHVAALTQAKKHLQTAQQIWKNQGPVEFLAQELRWGQQSLEGITGVFTSDALLGEIFSSFCIGK